MEGPTVYRTAQQLQPFKGKKIIKVGGNTSAEFQAQFLNMTVQDIFCWGKHLVFQFDDFALRVHFMILGTYEGDVDGTMIYGDYKKTKDLKLQFDFPNGWFAMYSCNLKFHPDEPNLKRIYDYTTDVMAKEWDSEAALAKVQKKANAEISDALLDQKIFTGVGNKIRNEVLFTHKLLPTHLVKDIDLFELRSLVEDTHALCWQFLEWRDKDQLNTGEHWKIYKKKVCPVCGGKVTHAYTGKNPRSSYFCEHCQK
jgi:endonuclease-8